MHTRVKMTVSLVNVRRNNVTVSRIIGNRATASMIVSIIMMIFSTIADASAAVMISQMSARNNVVRVHELRDVVRHKETSSELEKSNSKQVQAWAFAQAVAGE